MPPDLAELRRWLEKAHHDTRTVEVAIDLTVPIPDTAAFHCQQAAEKLLKAYLFWKGFEFERIHDLRTLTLDCCTLDEAFRAWVDRLSPLTNYGVRYRYPGPNDPTVDEVRDALAIVREVWDFVIARLPAGIWP